jgi:hypothetical protein
MMSRSPSTPISLPPKPDAAVSALDRGARDRIVVGVADLAVSREPSKAIVTYAAACSTSCFPTRP